MKHYILLGANATEALLENKWKELEFIINSEDISDELITFEYQEDNLNLLFDFLLRHSDYRELNTREIEQIKTKTTLL